LNPSQVILKNSPTSRFDVGVAVDSIEFYGCGLPVPVEGDCPEGKWKCQNSVNFFAALAILLWWFQFIL
jgi:hypothetical protein